MQVKHVSALSPDGRTAVAWDFTIWTTTIERDAADPADIVIIIIVVVLLFLLAGVVIALLIESGGSGGFEVPLPSGDGVIVVDRDLHRGSMLGPLSCTC